MKPKLLQLTALRPTTQERLEDRFQVLSWPADEAAQEVLLAEHGADIKAVVTGGHGGISSALADRLPSLGIVAVNGVGYDRIDLGHARARGFRVTNTPDVLTDDVADLAIALMLNCMRCLPAAEQHVRAGRWPGGEVPLARRASGLRYGIVGFGRIGQGIARRLTGFGGSIAYMARSPRPGVGHAYHADIVSLAHACDVLFVALAASTETAGIIDAAVLEALGPDGVLVNIARGSVIDEEALVSALVGKRIAGAGLDVFAREPHVPEALLDLPNVALAPHVGSATVETREAMGQLMLANLDAFFSGKELPTPVV